MGDKELATAAKAKGNEAFAAKRFPEAIEHFTEAIGHDATDHVFFSNRSACHASLEQFEKAFEDGKRCVEMKPEWPKGYARKGLAEFFLRRFEDAAGTYQAGLKLAPEDSALKEGLKKAMDAKYDVESPRRGPGLPKFDASMLAMLAAHNPKVKEHMQDPAFMRSLNSLMAAGSAQAQEQMLMQLVQSDRQNGMKILEVVMAAQGVELKSADDLPGDDAGDAASGAEPAAKRPRTQASASASAAGTPGNGRPGAPAGTPSASPKLSEADAEAEKLKAEGNAAYKKKNFEEALGLYDKAIEKQPNDLVYYNNKCAVWIEMGEEQYPKVLETCEGLIERRYEINTANPGGASFEKIAKVYVRMASVCERQKKFDEAIEFYNKSLTEDNNRHTRNALREVQKAKDKFDRESLLDPVKAEEHRAKGNEFFKSSQWADAKREYDEAIAGNPADAKLFSNRAAALTKLMAYPDALRDLDECLRLDPKFVKAYSRKGAAHFWMKEYSKALEAYERGLEVEGESKNEECLRGREQVINKIAANQRIDAPVDEEQVRHAMADPEIQQIMKDPQMKMFLQRLQEDPQKGSQEMHKDPKLKSAVTKLMAAGILRMR